MDIKVNLPRGTRVDPQRVFLLLTQAMNGQVQLPPDPGEGQETVQLPVEGDSYMQISSRLGDAGAQALIRQAIALAVGQGTQPHKAQPQFQLSEGVRESFGLALAIAIPIILAALLIWLLGRGATTASGGFTKWIGTTAV